MKFLLTVFFICKISLMANGNYYNEAGEFFGIDPRL